jgi:exodeoxyribonuclease VII small subunit
MSGRKERMSKIKTYGMMMSELRETLRDMQSGVLDVDEMVAKYEKGQSLVEDLEKYLKEAKNSITHRKADAISEVD